jgi:hypothetical protein
MSRARTAVIGFAVGAALAAAGWYVGSAYPAPQPREVFELATYKCSTNGGLRRLQQRGLWSLKRYDFACLNDAQFIGVETKFETPELVATKDVVGKVGNAEVGK